MVLSLQEMCMTTISNANMININKILPSLIYIEYVNFLKKKNFNIWKGKMKIVNLEVNIKDIEVELNMYFDEPTYYIFVRNKISNYYEKYMDNDIIYNDEEYESDDEYGADGEYILYHEFSGDQTLYYKYYEIVKSRKLINNALDDFY